MLKIIAIVALLTAVVYIGNKLRQISKQLESISKMFGDKHDDNTPHIG